MQRRKSSLLSVVGVVTSLVLVLGITADAQSLALRVQVPFSFYVGTSELPAGNYLVQRLGETVRVSDDKGRVAAVITNASKSPSARGVEDQLVFTAYGSSYFLSEVRWRNYSDGRALVKSKMETDIAKNFDRGRVVMTAALRP